MGSYVLIQMEGSDADMRGTISKFIKSDDELLNCDDSPELVVSTVESNSVVRSRCPLAPKKPHPPSPPPKSLSRSPLAKIASNQVNFNSDSIPEKDLIFGGGSPSMSLLAQKVREQIVSKIIVVLGPYAAVGPQHMQRYAPSSETGVGGVQNTQPLLSLELVNTTLPGLKDRLLNLGFSSLEEANNEKLYKSDPTLLCDVWRDLWPTSSKPLLPHILCKILSEKGLLLRVYSYNMESLERAIGIPRSKVIELNGTFGAAHCIECDREHMSTYLKEKLHKNQRPKCTFKSCKGLVRPSIYMKGQKKEPPHSRIIETDMNQCDLVISIGTIGSNVSDLVDVLAPRLIVNTLKASFTNQVIDSDNAHRDVVRHCISDGLIEFIKECNYETHVRELLPTSLCRSLQVKMDEFDCESIVRSHPVLTDNGGILKRTIVSTTSLLNFPHHNRKNRQVRRRAPAPPIRSFNQVIDFNKTICRSATRSASAGPNIPMTGNRTPQVKPLSAPSTQFVKDKTVQFDPCIKYISEDQEISTGSGILNSGGDFLRTPNVSPLAGSLVSSPSMYSSNVSNGSMSPFALLPLVSVDVLSPLLSPTPPPLDVGRLPLQISSVTESSLDETVPVGHLPPPIKCRSRPVNPLSDVEGVRLLSETISLSPPKRNVVRGTPKVMPLVKPFR